jgi:hypothetical protein
MLIIQLRSITTQDTTERVILAQDRIEMRYCGRNVQTNISVIGICYEYYSIKRTVIFIEIHFILMTTTNTQMLLIIPTEYTTLHGT